MKSLTVICGLLLLLAGCASTEETNQLRRTINFTDQELAQYKAETNQKLAALARDTDNLKKQMLTFTSSTDDREDRMKALMGRIDELQHQLDTYWRETKNELAAIRKGNGSFPSSSPSSMASPGSSPAVKSAGSREKVRETERDPAAEAPYKDAFDTFQKGMYGEAVQKFSSFVDNYPRSSLTPNAYFWLGEAYMMLKDYDKAIVNFQELLDKFPKSEMASKALLSQADAFYATKDKKSSMTILKKIIELYPKTEEAAIAERKLRNLNF